MRIPLFSQVLAHPFWGMTTGLHLEDLESRHRAVLGYSLSTLSCIMRAYCEGLMDWFLEECRQKVAGGASWRQALNRTPTRIEASWKQALTLTLILIEL